MIIKSGMKFIQLAIFIADMSQKCKCFKVGNLENKWVLRLHLNKQVNGHSQMLSGIEFQTVGDAELKVTNSLGGDWWEEHGEV